jgi:DMSO/TMAO reductase YedYZ molybdopterin-dependent catalytic subunit
MTTAYTSRRELLKQGGAAVAVLAFFDSPLFAWGREGERTIPFLDQPPEPALPISNLLDWQQLDSYNTSNDRFFAVGHFGVPEIDRRSWQLELGGRIDEPRSYTLEDLKTLPKKEVVFALECSGNSGFDWFQGGIGNARWGGVSLGDFLRSAGILDDAVEAVFYGADKGKTTFPYIGGLGDDMGAFEAEMPFARSMTLKEALDPANILCYEMNGAPLPAEHGSPLRLIAPRWYGIANVKWLTRIEVSDAHFLGPFMSQRYVTVREHELSDGSTEWRRELVGKSRLKSMTAKVTVKDGAYRIYGAAWGEPVARVEVRIDEGPWMEAAIDQGKEQEFGWKFWHLDWRSPSSGEHRITSRAVGTDGKVQPSMDDRIIAEKRTYWESNGQITREIRIP